VDCLTAVDGLQVDVSWTDLVLKREVEQENTSQAARKPFLDEEQTTVLVIQDLFSGLGVLPSIYGNMPELLWS